MALPLLEEIEICRIQSCVLVISSLGSGAIQLIEIRPK